MTPSNTVGLHIGCLDFLLPSAPLINPVVLRSDLLFVIGAPEDFVPSTDESTITLFFDNHGQQRELPNNGYQVTCDRQLAAPEFQRWAQTATQSLPLPFLHQDMIGLDLADLRKVLLACSSHRLELHMIEYTANDQPPLAKLSTLYFSNLYACLFGNPELLTMKCYSDLGCVLEQNLPETAYLVLSTSTHNEHRLWVLLLGEVARPITEQGQTNSN